MTVGSRAEVFHGNADATSGGLTKKDLKLKDGRIISKAASKAAKSSLKLNPKFMAFIELAKETLRRRDFLSGPQEGSKTYKKYQS